MSSLSSADTVDFLTGPRSVVPPSSSDEEIVQDTFVEEPTVQSPVYEEDEVDPPQLPQPSTSKSKPKPKPKSKQNRKQEKPAKKKHRVLKDIRDLQATTNMLISKAPFQRYLNHLNTDDEFHFSIHFSDVNFQIGTRNYGQLFGR